MEPTVPTEDYEPPPKMTLRVYTVTSEGAVTNDTGVHGFEGGEEGTPTSLGQEYPPCACPWCSAARAAR